MKQLTINDENISHLADEILAIVWSFREETAVNMIASKHMVGEAIVTSPLYRKYAKTQSEFYEVLANERGLNPRILADCAKFYETYPNKKSKPLASKLRSKYGAWRNVRLALYGGDPNAVSKVEKSECKKCPIHCK